MFKKWVIIIFLILFVSSICEKDKKSETADVFKPTKEWKVIKEGQKVPSGLHYRINLSTGKKEAKINDAKDLDSSNAFSLVNHNDGKTIASEEIETILKEVDKKNPKNDMPTRFRTLEELKMDLGDLKLIPKSDAEVLQELFQKFDAEEMKKQPEDKAMLGILKDLVYLSHQYDNGNEFVRIDGFNKVIYKKLNSTNTAIKQEALKLFSSLVQNNAKVKIHALETGGITTLLRILNLDQNDVIQNSAATALSCLLRTFPYAQNKFIEVGGLNIFSELLASGSVKLKLKLVTLLHDLILERQHDKSNFEQHTFIDLQEVLFKLNWCNHLNQLLHDLLVIDMSDHDSIEKCLIAMKSMKDKCGSLYKKDDILRLYKQYENISSNNQDTSDYFKSLSELCKILINSSMSSREGNVKEEL